MNPPTLTDTERGYVAAAADGGHETARTLERQAAAEQAAREARLSAPGALLAAALWYASQGVAVFPCQPGGKPPATTHGFKDASVDPEQIRAWWKVNPLYNIGTPTGVTFDVFDIDGPEGLLAVHQYIDDGGFPPIIAAARTPRGRHYYVAPSGDGNATNFGGLAKVDYRGAGGYVIAPPSRTTTGTYRWFENNHLQPGAATA